MDKELHQLCKEVYEKTKWKGEGNFNFYDGELASSWEYSDYWTHSVDEDRIVPLYSTDYLLIKLPKEDKNGYTLTLIKDSIYVNDSKKNNWWCGYRYTDWDGQWGIGEAASTPLKAVLKLTLSLHEAGEL